MCNKQGTKCQICRTIQLYTLLKFINNSCRGNKGNHYSEGGLDTVSDPKKKKICDPDYHKIRCTFFLVSLRMIDALPTEL